jgi:DNA polymerase-3 subunit delta'
VSLPPAPRANPRLLGHEAAEAVLAEGMRAGRLHHAWLITGPPGVGKATLAYRFARRLFAGMPEGASLALPAEDPVFRRVAVGSHADLLTVEREWDPKKKRMRGEIVVADVRRVADFLRRTPAEGGWRVVVVDGAETLNRNAENALLKVLEEPPPRAILLLACNAAGWNWRPWLRHRWNGCWMIICRKATRSNAPGWPH